MQTLNEFMDLDVWARIAPNNIRDDSHMMCLLMKEHMTSSLAKGIKFESDQSFGSKEKTLDPAYTFQEK